MSDEVYAVLSGKFGGIVWQCSCCQAGTARIEATLKSMEGKLHVVEERLGRVEEKGKLTDSRLDRVEETAGYVKAAL